jgi:hypothetical protein
LGAGRHGAPTPSGRPASDASECVFSWPALSIETYAASRLVSERSPATRCSELARARRHSRRNAEGRVPPAPHSHHPLISP